MEKNNNQLNPKIILAGGGMVLNEAGKLLLIFRKGSWDLPKGKLDAGESMEACAIREVREETGLTNLVLGPLLSISHHSYFDPYLQEKVIKETHWYRMQALGNQSLVPQTEEDITEIGWYDKAALAEKLKNSFENIIHLIQEHYLNHQ